MNLISVKIPFEKELVGKYHKLKIEYKNVELGQQKLRNKLMGLSRYVNVEELIVIKNSVTFKSSPDSVAGNLRCLENIARCISTEILELVNGGGIIDPVCSGNLIDKYINKIGDLKKNLLNFKNKLFEKKKKKKKKRGENKF